MPDNNQWQTFVVDVNGEDEDEDIDITLQSGHTIDRMDCYSDVQLWSNGALLTIKKGLVNHGYLGICRVLIAYLHIKADVTNLDGAFLELGFGEIRDNLYNHAGGIVQSEYVFEIGDNMENAGLIIIHNGGHIYSDEGEFHNSGRVELTNGTTGAAEGPFYNKQSGLVKGSGMLHCEKEIQNQGNISASGGSLLLYTEGILTNTGILGNRPLASLNIKPAEDVNNFGTIEVNSGGGVAFDCNVVNEPNAVIELFGGTLAAKTITQKADSIFNGQGDITGNLVIETEGLIQLTGPANIFGNVQIDPNATLEISDGTTLITGQTSCNGTIHMKGGRIIPQGGFSGDCNIIWEPGVYTNIADFNLDGMVNLQDFAVFADTWLWQTGWR